VNNANRLHIGALSVTNSHFLLGYVHSFFISIVIKGLTLYTKHEMFGVTYTYGTTDSSP